jgi:SPW repeat
MEKYLSKTTVGWAAIGFGAFIAVTPAWAATTAAGAACTLAMGAFTAYFGVLGLLVRNPTPTHWGLVVVGLSLFIAPWLAAFAGDGAAWTAWVSGFVVWALGLMAWMRDGPPTATGINEYGIGDPNRRTAGAWVGGPVLVVGIVAAAVAGIVHSSAAATCFGVGLGALIAVLALWSLLATDPTVDHLKIATTGLALFIAPWVFGFAADRGAWMAWVAGFIATALGVAGYLRGESLDHTRLVRDEAVAAYQRRFPQTDSDGTARMAPIVGGRWQ